MVRRHLLREEDAQLRHVEAAGHVAPQVVAAPVHGAEQELAVDGRGARSSPPRGGGAGRARGGVQRRQGAGLVPVALQPPARVPPKDDGQSHPHGRGSHGATEDLPAQRPRVQDGALQGFPGPQERGGDDFQGGHGTIAKGDDHLLSLELENTEQTEVNRGDSQLATTEQTNSRQKKAGELVRVILSARRNLHTGGIPHGLQLHDFALPFDGNGVATFPKLLRTHHLS